MAPAPAAHPTSTTNRATTNTSHLTGEPPRRFRLRLRLDIAVQASLRSPGNVLGAAWRRGGAQRTRTVSRNVSSGLDGRPGPNSPSRSFVRPAARPGERKSTLSPPPTYRIWPVAQDGSTRLVVRRVRTTGSGSSVV